SGALEARTALPEDGVVDDHLRFRPHHLLLAEGHRYLGDDMAARRHYEAARAHLQERLRRTPNDPRIHGALGLALAGLGRSGEAVAHAERAVELMPVEREAFRGPQ
ncbi:MAG: tetratricopeptide repeat protein, partial [Gemmatimonadetes bacterium]|nr:tetratricopeptide repeat protein [Gemmatimonadota bacterium]NIX40619.1 tetratricopeptide repeat protein [Gemmatimonadota bacterium]